MNTPRNMKKFKKVLPIMMAAAITCTGIPMVAQADSSKVVTLGANLSEEQKTSMYDYFGTSADKVETIEVTNADERKYMEGIASEAQIGTRTYSCSYVEPTTSGGIQVKVANLTFVTSSMIASTLTTSGVENCNVVAASPIEVSGTGALTGIMMAYETASGETLNEDQKATATEELITTGELADAVGQQEATDLMNEIKGEVIEEGLTDPSEIQDTVNDAAEKYNITLTQEQMDKITALMESISQYDYDVKAFKETLDNLAGKEKGFFAKVWESIKGVFTGGSDDGGIINGTNDDALGADAIIDSTLDSVKDAANEAKEEGFWDKVVNFFKNLFGGDDADKEEDAESEDADKDQDADSEQNPDSEDPDASTLDDADAADGIVDDGTTDMDDTDSNTADTPSSDASETPSDEPSFGDPAQNNEAAQ